MNLSVNTVVGKQSIINNKKMLSLPKGEHFLLKTGYIAGGLLRVEKVKPDPLNLLVNTDEGKQKLIKDACLISESIFFIIQRRSEKTQLDLCNTTKGRI